MKDISPSEKEVLERAALHVPVFERSINKKPFKLDRGCFACNHNVGPMSTEGFYTTITVSVPAYEYSFSFVAGIADRFWSNFPYEDWRHKLIRSSKQYSIAQGYATSYEMGQIWDALEVYVRLYLSPEGELIHNNGRINLQKYLTDMPSYAEVYTRANGAARGAYLYPDYFMADEEIGMELITDASRYRFADQARLERYGRNLVGGRALELSKIKNKKSKTDSPKHGKISYTDIDLGGNIHDPTTTWVPNWGITTTSVHPFEQGDS